MGQSAGQNAILISGNEAAGEAAMRAGCTFYAGYPITPQNELTAYMADQLPLRGGTFIQAESELAAINMVYGASAAGARAMTSSSSPGVSLKQEGISYLAGSELPAVIINVMRGGPGLGNISPSQADYYQTTRGGGHGDYRTIALAPSTVQEVADLTYLAFDLADRYLTPVIILSDGMLGQMMEGARFDHLPPPQPAERPWALTGRPGRKRNQVHSFYATAEMLAETNKRLLARYAQISAEEARHELYGPPDAEALLVAYGTCARICRRVVDEAAAHAAVQGGPVPARDALALPGGRPARAGPEAAGRDGGGDERRPDGGRRAPVRRGRLPRGAAQPRRRRGAHRRRGDAGAEGGVRVSSGGRMPPARRLEGGAT